MLSPMQATLMNFLFSWAWEKMTKEQTNRKNKALVDFVFSLMGLDLLLSGNYLVHGDLNTSLSYQMNGNNQRYGIVDIRKKSRRDCRAHISIEYHPALHFSGHSPTIVP
jgi:hypothetical protein